METRELRTSLDRLQQELENTTFIDASVTSSWLRDFLDYVRRNEGYSDVRLPVGTPAEKKRRKFDQTLSRFGPNG